MRNQLVPTFQEFAYGTEKLINLSVLQTVIIFSALSFLCTLFLPSVGEEGVYTNITLEMLHNKDYLVPTLFGTQYSRPPLFNWLMLPITQLLGPAHVLLAARLVNMFATVLTAYSLVYLVRRIFPEKQFALLAGAIYLSGDLLFKRGWLAYADSVFALCVFAAIASLWLALEQSKHRWLWLACLSLCCAFLAKIHTAYIFYGIAGLVLLVQHKNRRYLFTPVSIILHVGALIFPIAWTIYVSRGYGGVATTWLHSQSFFSWPGLLPYLLRVFVTYPLDVAWRFLPTSLIAAVMVYKLRSSQKKSAQHSAINIVFWIVLLNLLPYWLVPHSNIRYLLPLYPFIAILISYVIWQSGNAIRRLAVSCLIVSVVLKYVFALVWLPYEHTAYRGNAATVAADIMQRTQDGNLYINDSTSAGLRVAVELNKLRMPLAPLTLAPPQFKGYVLTEYNSVPLGKLVHTYNLRNNKINLYQGDV